MEPKQPTYDVSVGFYAYPEPDFLETGKATVVIAATVLEDGQAFASDTIRYDRLGENGLGVLVPVYEKFGAKVLKAGASRGKDRKVFRAQGVGYAKIVEFEQAWAELHWDLSQLGVLRIAKEKAEAEAAAAAAKKPAKPGRRRRRRK